MSKHWIPMVLFSLSVALAGCNHGVEANVSPTVTVNEPSAPAVLALGSAVQIEYVDADPDDDALTTVAADRDGDLLTTGDQYIVEADRPDQDGTAQSVTWDTTGVEPGLYRVLAVTDDGLNHPVVAEAGGTVLINAPPTVAVSSPATDGEVRVGTLVRIDYVDADVDDEARTDLYADVDGDPTTTDDRIAIDLGRPDQDGASQDVVWDTSGAPGGTYVIVAVTDDAVNPAVSARSTGTVTLYDPGNAIELAGDGGNVEFAEALIGDRTTYTVEFWIAPRWPPTQAAHPYRNAIYAESYDQGGSYNGAVRHFVQVVNEDDGTAPGYRLGAMTLENWPTDTLQTVFTDPLPEQEWHHVAFTSDGTSLRIFVNGVLHDEGPMQPYLGPEPVHFHLGLRLNPVSGDNYGWAILDDLRVSSVVRYTEDFVPPRLHAMDADTLSLWRFDESTGATTSDATGNHGDGSLSVEVVRVVADR